MFVFAGLAVVLSRWQDSHGPLIFPLQNLAEGEDKAEFVDELIAMLNFRGCTVNGQLSTVRGVKTESSKLSIIHLQKFPQLLFVVNKASLTYLESQKPFLRCGGARNRS